MPFPAGYTTYYYAPANVYFARIVESDEVQPWFYAEDQYVKDPVLPLVTMGGGAVSKVFISMGAAVAAPLTFRASCLSAADRFALKNARRTSGVLTSTTGPFSATALCFKATPVNANPYGLWLIDLGFELVPA